MKGHDSTDQGKNKTHMNIKISHATEKTQRQTHGPIGMCELFLLTVPIEEVARCQYKTVQIIFPLNLQTITITLDVKWRGGGHCSGAYHQVTKGKSSSLRHVSVIRVPTQMTGSKFRTFQDFFSTIKNKKNPLTHLTKLKAPEQQVVPVYENKSK